MTLNLSPVQETELQAAARQEGMPVDDYAHQLFVTALRERLPLHAMPRETQAGEPLSWEAELQWAQQQAREALAVSGKTDDEITADVEAEVDEYRAEGYARTQAPIEPR